jgi:nucleoside-diphosphate-sugar epimerase
VHYFVTGATGFVGGYVTSQLLAAGHEVTALVRTRDDARDISVYGVRPHVGSVTDKEAMRRGMRGVDGVFHSAGHRLAFRDRKLMEAINVGGTRNVFELVRELSIPKCVFTSTLNVFSDTQGRLVDEDHRFEGTHLTEYDRVRAEAHFGLAVPFMRADVPIVTLLPGMVYGPRDTSPMAQLLTRALLGRVIAVSAQTAYCWAHVMDVAHAHLLAMQFGRTGESYIVAGPPHTVREALVVVGDAAGKRRHPIPIPSWVPGAAATVVGAAAAVIPPWRWTAGRLRVAAGVTYLGDDTKAREELGFAPRPIVEGLPDAARAILEEMIGDPARG